MKYLQPFKRFERIIANYFLLFLFNTKINKAKFNKTRRVAIIRSAIATQS